MKDFNGGCLNVDVLYRMCNGNDYLNDLGMCEEIIYFYENLI